MKLSELIASMEASIMKGLDTEITGISYDSRKVETGDLYIAITGLKMDGRRFIADAIAAGAAAIACEKTEGITVDIPLLQVPDARKFLAQASAKLTGYPDREMTVIGVTGTNGKTTFTYLMQSILKASNKKTGIIGTTGFFDGHSWQTLPHTTPESADLWRLLRKLRELGNKAVVMEISSHAIALKRVYGLDIDIAVFTNLTQDHLDFHTGMDEYKEVKFSLFSTLKNEGTAVINIDDTAGIELLSRHQGKAISYSAKGHNANLRINLQSATLKGSKTIIQYKNSSLSTFVNLPGIHNLSNAAAAAAAGFALGIEGSAIKRGIEELLCVPGRMEAVPNDKGYFIFIDYAHTPDALKHLIQSVKLLTQDRVLTLFGCGGDRDHDKRPKMGKIASELSDYIFVTSDNPRTETPERIIEDILAGVKTDDKKVIVDRREAIFEAVNFMREGDVLLVAGKGHERYQILGTEKIHFDDKEVVREALDALP